MRTHLRLALVASVVLAAAAAPLMLLDGCTGDDDGASPADSGATDASVTRDAAAVDAGAADAGSDAAAPTTAQACADSAHARCVALDSCSNGAETVLRWGSEAVCEARLAAQCEANLGATGTGATAATTEVCAQAVPGESCYQVLANALPEECVPVTGTVANGGACFVAAQCASTFCSLGAHATCGTCAPVPGAGASCATTADCGGRAGLVCASSVCVAYADAGAACNALTAPCGPGDLCTTPAADAGSDAGGTCQPAGITVGAACNAASVGLPACDATYALICEKGACATITYADAGSACGDDGDGGVVRCAASGTCGGVGKGQVCLAAAADNAACDTAIGPACLPQARCAMTDGGTAGTCISLSAATCP